MVIYVWRTSKISPVTSSKLLVRIKCRRCYFRIRVKQHCGSLNPAALSKLPQWHTGIQFGDCFQIEHHLSRADRPPEWLLNIVSTLTLKTQLWYKGVSLGKYRLYRPHRFNRITCRRDVFVRVMFQDLNNHQTLSKDKFRSIFDTAPDQCKSYSISLVWRHLRSRMGN